MLKHDENNKIIELLKAAYLLTKDNLHSISMSSIDKIIFAKILQLLNKNHLLTQSIFEMLLRSNYEIKLLLETLQLLDQKKLLGEISSAKFLELVQEKDKVKQIYSAIILLNQAALLENNLIKQIFISILTHSHPVEIAEACIYLKDKNLLVSNRIFNLYYDFISNSYAPLIAAKLIRFLDKNNWLEDPLFIIKNLINKKLDLIYFLIRTKNGKRLLEGANAKANFIAVISHPNHNDMVFALNKLKENDLLTISLAQINIEILLLYKDPVEAAFKLVINKNFLVNNSIFHLLKKANLLTLPNVNLILYYAEFLLRGEKINNAWQRVSPNNLTQQDVDILINICKNAHHFNNTYQSCCNYLNKLNSVGNKDLPQLNIVSHQDVFLKKKIF